MEPIIIMLISASAIGIPCGIRQYYLKKKQASTVKPLIDFRTYETL